MSSDRKMKDNTHQKLLMITDRASSKKISFLSTMHRHTPSEGEK